MGGPPAVIIVVRHGSRLDAADKQWHLNSPTPYDPPLTYGGWTQCRSLGVRIAQQLSELSSQPSHDLTDQHKRKRKQRVVIHSSPFLRCIQTSIALASGMASTPAHSHPDLSLARRAVTMPQFSHSAARSSSRNRLESPMLAPLHETSPSNSPPTTSSLLHSKGSHDAHKDAHAPIPKAILRVDAFLGEWLSPDYFEQITPPPSSVMMVAAAKADLLRREDYAHLTTGGSGGGLAPPTTGFPGGWGSPLLSSKVSERPAEEDNEDDLPAPALPLPKRDRTSSMSSVGSSASSRLSGHPTIRPSSSSSHHHHENSGYVPPQPHYAISSGDPIPPGYVAHSKDACIEVDYQWDSMRAPQNWGSGGEYGEEWGSMHKRFRRGLKQLVEWYRYNDPAIHKVHSRPGSRPGTSGGGSENSEKGGATAGEEEQEDEEEEDLVVILVTHGAGCNALIGALTNQPALLDVGMANLTMAVRRPPYQPTYLTPTPSKPSTPAVTPRPTPQHSRSSSKILTLSDEYELRLLNSSDHLRRSSTASTTSSFSANLPSLPYRPFLARPPGSATTSESVASGSTSTLAAQGPFVDPLHLGAYNAGGGEWFQGAAAAGLRRTVSVASGSGSSKGERTYTPRFKGSVGLWSPRKPAAQEEEGEEDTKGDDLVLNFAEEREARAMAAAGGGAGGGDMAKGRGERERTGSSDGVAELETPKPSQGGGLWGQAKLPDEAGLKPEREMGPKRRWTLTEKGMVGETGLDRV